MCGNTLVFIAVFLLFLLSSPIHMNLFCPAKIQTELQYGLPRGSVVNSLPTNAGDSGSIPGLGQSPGGGLGSPLQYSCLGNPMDGGAWQVTGSQRVRHNLPTKTKRNLDSCIPFFTVLCLRFELLRKESMGLLVEADWPPDSMSVSCFPAHCLRITCVRMILR